MRVHFYVSLFGNSQTVEEKRYEPAVGRALEGVISCVFEPFWCPRRGIAAHSRAFLVLLKTVLSSTRWPRCAKTSAVVYVPMALCAAAPLKCMAPVPNQLGKLNPLCLCARLARTT